MAIHRKPLARVLVRPPSRPSNGAQTINEKLGLLSRLSRVTPVPKQYKLVVNWGNSQPFVTHNATILNQPSAIRMAANKLVAFGRLRDAGVRVPEFFTEPQAGSSSIFLARTVLSGSGGDGIVVIRPGDQWPAANLYVKYVRKVTEYRVHVAGGNVLFIQQKKRKLESDQTDDQKLIRNYDNGWVFCPIEMHLVGDAVKEEAVKTCAALGLDFGAVDLIIGKKDGLAYILEVNTAPGLESPGLIDAYVNYIKEAVTL